MLSVQTTEASTRPAHFGFVYGRASAVQAMNSRLGEIAPTDIPVLLVGETGTGKDAYSRLIHRLSQLRDGGFHKIDCASFNPGHIYSTLASTKASHSAGPQVHTFYLDNVHELDPASQRALLSLLEYGQTSAFGDAHSFRFISSTAVNLEKEVESGKFRRELYFRLNGTCLRLPALRDRVEDIPALAEFFLEKYSSSLKKTPPTLSAQLITELSSCSWPGNIRELENLVRQMVLFGDAHGAIRDFQAANAAMLEPPVSQGVTSLKTASRAASVKAERSLILEALERTHWNRKRAARELQISYKSLLYKIKQIGVTNEKQQEKTEVSA